MAKGDGVRYLASAIQCDKAYQKGISAPRVDFMKSGVRDSLGYFLFGFETNVGYLGNNQYRQEDNGRMVQ